MLCLTDRSSSHYAVDRAAVEQLAAEQKRDRERPITIQEASRLTSLPPHVWRRLVRNGQLKTWAGDPGARNGQTHGTRLVSRADVQAGLSR